MCTGSLCEEARDSGGKARRCGGGGVARAERYVWQCRRARCDRCVMKQKRKRSPSFWIDCEATEVEERWAEKTRALNSVPQGGEF